MHKQLIKWLSEIIKEKKRECHICQLLGDAVLIIQKFSDVTDRKMVFSMESKQTIYILHILYTNSKLIIDLPYNSTDLLPANKHNQLR